MAQFHIGQRVRVKHAPLAPHLVGAETRITGESVYRGIESWVLDLPCPLRLTPFWICPKECADICLEPILDQHEPCEEEFKRDLDRMLERENQSIKIADFVKLTPGGFR